MTSEIDRPAPPSRPMAIAARHRIYVRLALAFRDDPRLPVAARGSRFFEAAAKVTGPAALGGLCAGGRPLALLARCGAIDAAACHHLDAINARLLEANLAVVRRVLFEWRELRSPLAPAGPPLAALAFDEAMVVFEQRTLDHYLQRHAVAPAARRGIDALLGWCGNPLLQRLFAIDADLGAAVRAARCERARGRGFFAIETRIAIGQQLVRRLHAAASTKAQAAAPGNGTTASPTRIGPPSTTRAVMPPSPRMAL